MYSLLSITFPRFFSVLFKGLANRFEEYPKLRELIRLKDELISTTNTPPM